MPIYGIVSYGIVKGLNMRVVIARDEGVAAYKFIKDWQKEDGKLYFVDTPSYNFPTKHDRKIRLSEYTALAMLMGEVFDLKPGYYGGSTMLRGDDAIVLRSILRRESEIADMHIIARTAFIKTPPLRRRTTKCKWIVVADKGGIGVCRALR